MKSDERFVLSSEEAKIAEDNLDLVKWIVNHKIQWHDQEDFQEKVQIGSIGLIKAVKTFDESKGLKFATYATTCILNEIRMDGRKSKNTSKDISIEQPVAQDENGAEMTIGDILVDERSSDFEGSMEKRKNVAEALMVILNSFPLRQRFIMLLSIAGVTQIEIASLLGISRSYVSRLVKKCKQTFEINLSKHQSEEEYREVFNVVMDETTIRISFSTDEVENFNQSFAKFLSEVTATEFLTDFEIRRSKKQVTIYLPAEKEALSLLAMLVKDIETFQVRCETNLPTDNE